MLLYLCSLLIESSVNVINVEVVWTVLSYQLAALVERKGCILLENILLHSINEEVGHHFPINDFRITLKNLSFFAAKLT